MTIEEKIFPKINFEIICHEENFDFKKEFSFKNTGVDHTDTIKWIEEELNNYNSWAWCCVEVKAEYNNIVYSDYLSCCSYKNEEDFKEDCYIDMQDNCLHEIVKIVEQIIEDIK